MVRFLCFIVACGVVPGIIILSACNGSEADRESEQDQTIGVEATSIVTAPTSTEAAGSGVSSPIAPLAATSIPSPSPTPTLNFPAWQYASPWSLSLRYEVRNGGPFLTVDEWVYSGQVVIRVLEDGSASGRGVLYPAPLDSLCTVTPFDTEGFPFNVAGNLRYDGERIWLDIELIPQDYFYVESYTVLCPDYTEPRLVSSNFLWPMLGQINALKYTFWVEQNSFTINYNENLDARTGSVFRGELTVDLILQQ